MTASPSLTRVAHEFLAETRASRQEAGALTLEQKVQQIYDDVKRLEARLLVLESRNPQNDVNEALDRQLRKAESLIQALLVENQRLRSTLASAVCTL